MKLAVCFLAVVLLPGILPAQQEKEPAIVEKEVRVVVAQEPGASGTTPATFSFISAEVAFTGKVVKGKPYSAEAVTETRQVLPDGNRINRKLQWSIYRDGEGRTRREQTLAMVGALGAAGSPPQTILIDDPVAGVHYVLNPQEHTARKMTRPAIETIRHSTATQKDVLVHVQVESSGPKTVTHVSGGPAVFAAEGPNLQIAPVEAGTAQYRNESLGTQVIEGVQAEGTRTVTTIPAGEAGNERPIESVFERWYSAELEAVVMTKQTDPRTGETVYRLSGLRLGEPARQLFEVPADYKVTEGGGVQVRHQRK
jgi:hypothetical protein